ncbi:MAG: hypothetical protein IPK17_04685 [Chloroflexi bacterium]|uniref:hypothetical protein n=1 Tax=Candidatus Flexifilum breve TaxID=3140694 RepID=UPI0031347641|nr:hypothetical protein [Chloroflexota bacterium]
MNYAEISRRLIEQGNQAFNQRQKRISEFTKIPEVDERLNNLDEYPHLFVLGCVMDQQGDATRFWKIPVLVADLIGGMGFTHFAATSDENTGRFLRKENFIASIQEWRSSLRRQ